MVGNYFFYLMFVALFALVLAAFKLRGTAAALVAIYNAVWMGAVFASGNGFAFGYEPETIATLDGQWIILMALPQLLIGSFLVIQQEIHTRRQIPKKPKASTKPAPRKGK